MLRAPERREQKLSGLQPGRLPCSEPMAEALAVKEAWGEVLHPGVQLYMGVFAGSLA